MRPTHRAGLLVTILLLVAANGLHAQASVHPLPTWQAALLPSASGYGRWAAEVAPRIPPQRDSLRTRSHTGTGLLVGGLIGVAATTVFLIGFCSDSDTECGIDEVGRAVVLIAVPAAAVGALIGSLIHTED
jgi:hypothetical protein